MLVSILACLCFLSILGVSGPYLTLSGLTIICLYLLLRCLLSDMCYSLFGMVIRLSPLIYRMVIYIFLLLRIIIVSYNIFDSHALSVEGLTFWAGNSTHQTYFVPFAIARISILLSIWMTSWSWFTLSRLVGGAHSFLCSLLVCLGLHINFSKSDLHLTQTF